MGGPEAGAEQTVTPEREAASYAVVAYVAAGEFDASKQVTSLPSEVSRNAFDALNNHNMVQRLFDEDSVRQQFQQKGGKYSRDAHMSLWALGAAHELATRLADISTSNDVATILKDKLQIPLTGKNDVDSKIVLDHLLGNDKQGGEFYNRFCGNDMPEKLAKTLSVNEMRLLKPFLTNWMLGGSDEAFDALITLRTAIDTVNTAKTNQKLKGTVEANLKNPLTQDDKDRLAFWAKAHAISEEELKQLQDQLRQTPGEQQAATENNAQTKENDEQGPLPAKSVAETEGTSISGVGLSESQGRRSEMEDAHVVEQNLGGKSGRDFYAIYDGHGGREIADKAAARLHQELIRQLDEEKLPPLEALKKAYALTDASMEAEQIPGGATTITALIDGDKLYVANLGDARAVMIHGNGQAERLSHDRKANDPEEQREVEARGGTVVKGRVVSPNQTLAVSAALGDFAYQGLRKEPDLRETTITLADKWVILACDGVWDVIRDDEVAGIIGNETSPQRVSALLLQEAYKRNSGDNLSVIALAIGTATQPTKQTQQPTTPTIPAPSPTV